jgi:hypothetical protein
MAGNKTPRRIKSAAPQTPPQTSPQTPPQTPRKSAAGGALQSARTKSVAASAAGGAPQTPRRIKSAAGGVCPTIPTDEMQYTGRNKDAILYRQLLLAILGKNKDDIKSLQVCQTKGKITEYNTIQISTDLIHSMRPIFQFTPELFGDSLDGMFKSAITEPQKTKIKTEFAKVINMGGRKDSPANGNNFFKLKTGLNPTLIDPKYLDDDVKTIEIDTFNKGVNVKINSDIKDGVNDFESLGPDQRLQQNIKDVPFYVVINEMTSSKNPVPHHTLSIICYKGNIYSYGLGAVRQHEGSGSHIKDIMLDAHISIEDIFKNSVYAYKDADASRPAAILESKFQIVDIGILTSKMVTKLEDYLKNPMGITITSDFGKLYGGDFFVYFSTDIYVYPSTTYYTYYASTNSLISSCCTKALKALNKTAVQCSRVKKSTIADKLKTLVESGQVGEPKNTSCVSFIADIYGIDCGFCGIADPQGCNRIPQDRLVNIIGIIAAKNGTVGELLKGLRGDKISDHPYKTKLWTCAAGLTGAALGLIYYTGMGQGQFKSKKKSKTKTKSKSSKKSKAKTQKKSMAKNKSSKKSRRRLNKF